VHREVKVSPRPEIRRRATVARIKTQKEGQRQGGGGNPAQSHPLRGMWAVSCLGGGWLMAYILHECGGRVRAA
jgi:hypothetical protein